jgi:hypothetical protein
MLAPTELSRTNHSHPLGSATNLMREVRVFKPRPATLFFNMSGLLLKQPFC